MPRAVLDVFVALYEKGYIYRDRYLVNWDPGMRSAISDLEVEQREVTDTLYYIDYPLVTGSGSVTIATVRPETMLADVAIAVHPEDDRYRRLVGEKAVLPLVGRKLKIIADEYVKPEFGTGALKITPGHDPTDFDIGRASRPPADQRDRRGRAHDRRGAGAVRGDDGAGRREAVVAELREQGLIDRTEEYLHEVPFSQRSGERIEPLISLQWFMKMDELVKPAIDVVDSGQVRLWPENYKRVYLNWMENIRPWTISRQLWWGHQIPVWYRGDERYVGTEPPEGEGWTRDPDVLDTWFSSGLFPFAALGWPEETPALQAFYPDRRARHGARHHLPLGRADDHARNRVHRPDPVHRRVRALDHPGARRPANVQVAGDRDRPDGPDRGAYGADAVRWGLLAMSSTQDVKFQQDKVAQAQQLTNKLWNASRLILLGVGEDVRAAITPRTVEDRWILSRLERAKADTSARIERFDFSHAALGLYEFVYGELCDWYLELVKPRLRAGEPELAGTLLHVLTQTLALAHPIMPFVTEEIYSYVPGADGLLAAGIPDAGEAGTDVAAEATVARLIEAVQALRTWRDQAGVRPGATLPARLAVSGGYEDTAEHLQRLARVAFAETNDGELPVASVPIQGGAVEIFASDELDLEAAGRKLAARREQLEAEIQRAERKLSNDGFVAKAPKDVVDGERDKLTRLREELAAL